MIVAKVGCGVGAVVAMMVGATVADGVAGPVLGLAHEVNIAARNHHTKAIQRAFTAHHRKGAPDVAPIVENT
jgi:hypothetical protein